jgi:hypothetical protein
MYVSLETLRRAVSLMDSLAQLDDPACFAGIVLPGLPTLVGCDVLTYNEIGSAPGETRYSDYPAGALDPATQPVFAAYVHEHPLVNHYRATGSGEPVMISDFLSGSDSTGWACTPSSSAAYQSSTRWPSACRAPMSK